MRREQVTQAYSRRENHVFLGVVFISLWSDIALYQSMKAKAYQYLYHNQPLCSKDLKAIYHTNDYFPLSAISEAKGVLKSQKTWYKKTIQLYKSRLKKIHSKILKEEKSLKMYEDTLNALILFSKNHEPVKRCSYLYWNEEDCLYCVYKGEYMSLYLFEVRYLKPLIKTIKNKIKLLRYRETRLSYKLMKLEKKMKQIVFKQHHSIKITGRAQGKYCNNLFKYDYHTNRMTYIDSHQKRIEFPLDFPYRKEELIRVLDMKHATKGKAVCYTLVDKGQYFIIYATIELNIKYHDYLMDTDNGVIGIDINSQHISISETDDKGNLVYCHDILLNIRYKKTHQRNWIVENTIKEIFQYCKNKNKPLVIEELNFTHAKERMKMYDKKEKQYNHMLSEFAYRKIKEKIYSRAYKDKIGVIEVDPSYTSLIGLNKYSQTKGISIHKAASYVIGRRGMGYKERIPYRHNPNIHQPFQKRIKEYVM